MNISDLIKEQKIYSTDVDNFNNEYNSYQKEVYRISSGYRCIANYKGREYDISHITVDDKLETICITKLRPTTFVTKLTKIRFIKE